VQHVNTASCRLLYARPVTHRNRHTDILQHVVLLDLLSCSSLQAVVFVAVCRVCATCHTASGLQCITRPVTHRNRHRRPAACCATRLLSCGSLPAVVFLLHAQGLCIMSRPGRYSLVSLTDLTSQQIHRCLLICLASRVGHAGRMLLSSAICRLLCLLLCAGFVQHVTAARQVQPGLFDRLDTSQQIHRCLLMPCISCRSCRSDAAVLCHLPVVVFIAVCTGFVQHVTARQVQPGLFDRLDTSQQMHRCLLVCLESRAGHAVPCSCLLSAGCCAVACTGLCNMSTQAVTGCKVCFTDPTHQNNRAREL
jgi:hypothetical protein